jgi:predicted AAA+ superfamily ATPase
MPKIAPQPVEFQRLLRKPDQSFFLFGPRGVGKSTWLRAHFAEAIRIDLLKAQDFLQLSKEPGYLEARIGKKPPGSWVLIDEIQKLPDLLDEVHRLMEEKRFRFALSGSSARKLKRSEANLLAGRAVQRLMFPFASAEMGAAFDLDRALEWGNLPLATQSPDPADFLQSYLFTYLKEEIQEEGLVRQIEPFVRFLEIAGLANGQTLNIESVAREAGAKRVTVDNWFAILEDTLVGLRLSAWRPKIKVREPAHPKFYWFDTGVARAAAGLLRDPADRTWLGTALETQILHEIRTYNSTTLKNRPLFYYPAGANQEVDFIIETRKGLTHSRPEIVGIEVKNSKKWNSAWEAPLRDLHASGKVQVRRMIGVYRGEQSLQFGDYEVLPAEEFLKELHAGRIF